MVWGLLVRTGDGMSEAGLFIRASPMPPASRITPRQSMRVTGDDVRQSLEVQTCRPSPKAGIRFGVSLWERLFQAVSSVR